MSSLLLGAVVHIVAIVVGEIIDKTSVSVQYTDVDYRVFTDAAFLVYSGRSPYERKTYRYTPLLALLLVPNHVLSPFFGKLLFSTFDILSGFILYWLFRNWGISIRQATWCSLLWTLNPFVLFISTRGSADTIVCFFVFLTIFFLQTDYVILGALVYGLSVHFKVYPIIYALVFFLFCQNKPTRSYLGLKESSFLFAFFSFLSFAFFSFLSWWYYGDLYLQESWLYHAHRIDIRHNYSIFFYPFYLIAGTDHILTHIAWLPQLILLFLISIRLYSSLPISITLTTLLFVTFNRVVTAQYFLWWLAPLILEVPFSSLSITQWCCWGSLWFIAQNMWNLYAYRLEFKGEDTFVSVWVTCVIFFVVNCMLFHVILKYHGRKDVKME